jgi:hypothetical protein
MKPGLAAIGREALARLRGAPRSGDSFALPLTDANMPQMDGYISKPVQAKELLQARESLLPAAALSGRSR